MMANPPWTNEERNHHIADSGNLTESSMMRHYTGIVVSWNSEEDEYLVKCLDSYSLDSSLLRYVKIASGLQNKSVRDVATRCRWIYTKEDAKRRKEDHTGLGRARVDNKEIIDMVVASQQFEPSQHGITNELLKQNEQWFSQIYANLTSLNPMENLDLFVKIRKNINTLVDNLNENVSETMKRMPSLPEKLNDELLYELVNAIFPESNLPKLP